MKKITKKEEKNLRKNLDFLSKLNDSQRKYILSLMEKGIYDFDFQELKNLEDKTNE